MRRRTILEIKKNGEINMHKKRRKQCDHRQIDCLEGQLYDEMRGW